MTISCFAFRCLYTCLTGNPALFMFVFNDNFPSKLIFNNCLQRVLCFAATDCLIYIFFSFRKFQLIFVRIFVPMNFRCFFVLFVLATRNDTHLHGLILWLLFMGSHFKTTGVLSPSSEANFKNCCLSTLIVLPYGGFGYNRKQAK